MEFRNHYEWGDFKGDPDVRMERYFDAFVYLANWGSRQFSMRLPAEWLRESLASEYVAGDGVRLWIRSLASKHKSSFLRGVVLGDIADPRSALLRQFHRDRKRSRPSRRPARTAAQLLAEARSRAEQRRRRLEKKAAKLRARREREQAAAREAHLHDIGQRVDQVWREVGALIQTKRPRDYDRAARLLTDLRDAGTRTDGVDKFRSRLARLRHRHHRKPSLMGRLQRAGLI